LILTGGEDLNQRKKNLKDLFSGFAIVIIELALMVVATAAFISAFNYVDAKRIGQDSPQSTAVSSAVQANTGYGDASQTETVLNNSDWQLVLVNYQHKMPESFVNTIVRQFNADLDSRIVVPFQKMQEAALKDNIKIYISSGYRTPEKQDILFNQEIESFKDKGYDYIQAVNMAEKSVARAGYSEHNTGLALDLNGVKEDFDSTPEFQWLQEHAQDYGFVLRFPKDKQELTKIKFEPWHFRYVGVENAQEMKKLGMCLEEYINYKKEKQSANN
jgi:D-alanyl-D-alanine carboxypeptidase